MAEQQFNFIGRNSFLSVVILSCLLIVFLGGCRTSINMSPTLPDYYPKLVETLVKKYSNPDAIPTGPNQLDQRKRNEIIEELIFLIDVNYHNFEENLTQGRALFTTVTDLTIIGLGGAGSLISATSTQQLLSAISGGIGGARTSIDKNFFQEKSSNALISTMRASRMEKLNLIRSGETQSLTDYPMSRALVDLADYYNNGTIVSALQTISSQAGKNEQTASAKISERILKMEVTYRKSSLADRIIKWISSDVDKDGSHMKQFKEWLSNKGISLEPATWLASSDTNDDNLLEVVKHFNIP